MRAAVVLLLAALTTGIGDESGLVRVQDQGKASLWVKRPKDEPLTLKLSETLTIVMRVEGDSKLEVGLTAKLNPVEGWYLELAGKASSKSLANGKGERWQQGFLATPLKPGSHPLKLPGLQIIGSGGKEQTVAWKPLEVRVTTVVAKVDASEARDHVGIEELPPLPPPPESWWPWLLWILPLAAVIAVVAWRWRSRAAVEPSPGAVAVRELEELGRLALDNAEAVKALHTRLSDVLRRYLEKRFGMPATQRTTAEFFAALAKTSPLAGPQQEILERMLRGCDLAKFAGVVPTPEECQQAVAAAREFVERTEELSSRSRLPGGI